MIHQKFDPVAYNAAALNRAFAAQFGSAIAGASQSPNAITVHFYDAPTEQQIDDAQAVIDAHDPVWASVDKTRITADGADEATITLTVPAPDVSGITATVQGAGTSQDVAIDFTGTITNQLVISSTDAQIIMVTINEPNRIVQTFRIEAI